MNDAVTPRSLGLLDDPHDRALVANVHPPDWRNPTASGRYNLVVIGGGTAGLISALGAAGLGARVALIERHLLGGDCLNHGCVPSKALIGAARAAAAARGGAEYGVRVQGEVTVDFAAVMERLRRLRAGISRHDSARRLAEAGVDVYLGSARFVGPSSLEVAGQRLDFHRAVIATGARAAVLPVPGLAEIGPLTNETVFSLTERPKRLLVIGAGPIGCELAQSFQRLGSEVSVVSLDAQVLPREDPDAAALVGAALERDGVSLLLGARLLRAEARPTGKVLVFDRGQGEESVEGDEVLVAVGRAANLEGLGLEAAGVVFHARGVEVDDRLRTTNPRIFAAGDVASPYQFTHAADAMARVVLRNALFFGRARASSLVIPWSTYTSPEIAHVGLSAEQARDRGVEVATHRVELSEVDRAVLDGHEEGFAQVHVEPRSGRILGATLVAQHAGDMIGPVVLAMTEGLPVAALARSIVPYPTQADVWKRLGDASQRARLTDLVRAWMGRWFRWWR